jgi:hypothetical protein
MSNVIDFLERMGQDADLRHADDKTVEAALLASNVDASVVAAIQSKNVITLAAAMDAQPNICCGLYPVQVDQKVA